MVRNRRVHVARMVTLLHLAIVVSYKPAGCIYIHGAHHGAVQTLLDLNVDLTATNPTVEGKLL